MTALNPSDNEYVSDTEAKVSLMQPPGVRRCTFCGVPLRIPTGLVPEVELSLPKGKPVMRVLLVKRKEIHRCQIAEPLPRRD